MRTMDGVSSPEVVVVVSEYGSHYSKLLAENTLRFYDTTDADGEELENRKIERATLHERRLWVCLLRRLYCCTFRTNIQATTNRRMS